MTLRGRSAAVQKPFGDALSRIARRHEPANAPHKGRQLLPRFRGTGPDRRLV